MRSVARILTVTNGETNGDWFDPEFCPAGTFAIGFDMMVYRLFNYLA